MDAQLFFPLWRLKQTFLYGIIYFSVMQIKRWERKDCKPNSLPKLHKMHVKVGDTVKVISGGEKGKIGEISKIHKHNSTVIIKDLNLKTKHVKSKEEGEQGQIIKVCRLTVDQLLFFASLQQRNPAALSDGQYLLFGGRKMPVM